MHAVGLRHCIHTLYVMPLSYDIVCHADDDIVCHVDDDIVFILYSWDKKLYVI